MRLIITSILMALFSVANLFAEAPKDVATTPSAGGSLFGGGGKSAGGLFGGSSFIWIMLLLLVVWYFLLILPQQRKEKKRKAMLDQMKKGDKVVTIGGMFGLIDRIDGDVVTLKVGGNTIEFMKSAVSRVVSGPNADKPDMAKS